MILVGSSVMAGLPLRCSSSLSFYGLFSRASGFSCMGTSFLPTTSVGHVRQMLTTMTATGRCVNDSMRRPTGALLRTSLRTRNYKSKFSRCTSIRGMTSGYDDDSAVSFVPTDDAKRRNLDPECVSFVTGANRGIGFEITRQLLERTKGKVIAACRNPSLASGLKELAAVPGNGNRLDVVRLDIEDQASVESAAEYAKQNHGRIDLLFNVAGILGDGKTTPGPERSLRVMDREWLRKTLEVNTVGPIMLTAVLVPLMENTVRKGQEDAARPPSVVVNFSARVGSIGDNGMGGWHSYRMSKAALNMATKGISLELRRRRVWAFSYHPGTTDTGLSEPFQANVRAEKLFTTTYTVSQVLGIVDSMTEEHSGGFYAFDGSRIVW